MRLQFKGLVQMIIHPGYPAVVHLQDDMIIHQRCGFLCLHFKAASPFVKHAETNE